MIVLSDTGALKILSAYFKREHVTGTDLTLKLFVNNRTPADTDIAASYVEAVGGGYAAKTLAVADCTVESVDGICHAVFPMQTFAFTGPLTTNTVVYGAYVVDADNNMIFAEASAAYTPAADGEYDVLPKFQLSKGTPT